MSADWKLGIESTAPEASLVLTRDGEEVANVKFEARPNHSAVLSKALEEVLEALPEEARLAEVVVATGPGSYNGARVGIAAGQGVALVHGCSTVGIPSLEATDEVRSGRPALAVGDARRESYFAVPLDHGRVIGPPRLLTASEFQEDVQTAAEEGRWIFSLEDTGRLPLSAHLAGLVNFATPQARLAVASWGERSDSERGQMREIPPEPYYLRPPHITKAKARRPEQ